MTALDRDLDDLVGAPRPYEPPLPEGAAAPAPAATVAEDRSLGWIRRMLSVLLARRRQLIFGLSAAAVALLAQILAPFVVEELEPRDLFEWFVDLRKSFGFEVIALGPDAGSATVRALKANHVLALLCDRDLSGTGPAVEFFGERTTLPGGPATLALRTGAPILPTAIYFDGPDLRRSTVLPPLDTARQGKLRDDVQRVTQDIAHALEGLISAAPEQWHLLQPNWPSDPGYHR